MKINTNYKKPVPLYDISLGEMFEYRPIGINEGSFDDEGTPVYTPLIRAGANNVVNVKEGYLLALDPYDGYMYIIPRDKEVIPLESELTVKK